MSLATTVSPGDAPANPASIRVCASLYNSAKRRQTGGKPAAAGIDVPSRLSLARDPPRSMDAIVYLVAKKIPSGTLDLAGFYEKMDQRAVGIRDPLLCGQLSCWKSPRAGRRPPSQPSFYEKAHEGAVGRRGHHVYGPLSWRKNCKSKPIDRRDFLIWQQLRFLLFLPFRACYVRSPSLETLLHDDLP